MELGTMIPHSGGDYAYLMYSLGSLHPFWGPLPAFLYSWLMVLFLRPISLAVGCLTVAKYIVHPLWVALELCPDDGSQDVAMKLIAILCLYLIVAINSYSVEWSLQATRFFTGAKIIAILILIGCGIYQLYLGINKKKILNY